MRRTLTLLSGWLTLTSAAPAPEPVNLDLILSDALPPRLSDFAFFADAAATRPNARVELYTLQTPLFSDYAEKYRYLYVPPGDAAGYRAQGILDLPVGSALIKSFGYPADLRAPEQGVRLLETRILLHRPSGWVALPYVWNADGTDAELKRAGKRLDVAWTHLDGTTKSISYAVPNANQCKGCHERSGALVPVGPSARNLNHEGQLQRLAAAGLLDRAPADAPSLPRWDDAALPLEARARAYLDVNCANCHSRSGPASNSGLYLSYDETDPVALGLYKRPVAAGRGSGGFAFAIEPGAPERSILIHRMKSTEPGVAMPELGRATVHAEAVVLLSDWIAAMPAEVE
jgi:uncharacterized repeat protein (TIGR03806 family)